MLMLVSLLCWSVQSTLAVSSCDSSQERPPSLYEQYCCVKSNLGETIILTGEHKHTYIVCPLELLSICFFVGLIYPVHIYWHMIQLLHQDIITLHHTMVLQPLCIVIWT